MTLLTRPAGLLLAASILAVGGCGTTGQSPEAPPPAPTVQPSRFSASEFVGRWGFTSYHNEADRERTIKAASGQCGQPYVISAGPNGGVMMHLADQKEAVELQTKGAGGRDFIGLPNEPGGSPTDREIVSFDGRVLINRFVDADAAKRYGNMVFVRCGPRA